MFAVKVTEVPAQILFPGEAVMFTGVDGTGVTVMVPAAFTLPHPPVRGIEYVNVPD
jgi:hypothetical protein